MTGSCQLRGLEPQTSKIPLLHSTDLKTADQTGDRAGIHT